MYWDKMGQSYHAVRESDVGAEYFDRDVEIEVKIARVSNQTLDPPLSSQQDILRVFLLAHLSVINAL